MSADPDGDPLTYRWSLLAQDGPPLVIPGEGLPITVVQTLDDGQDTAVLEVSDGVHTATDTVELTVVNAEPVATGAVDAPTAGGVALLTASFTELGPLDTHAATVDALPAEPVTSTVTVENASAPRFRPR